MTYTFEEPEFPDAPKLADFGLVPEDYDRLKELNAEIAPIEKEIPEPHVPNRGVTIICLMFPLPFLPISLYVARSGGVIEFLPLVICICLFFAGFVLIDSVVKKYERRREDRLSPLNQVRQEQIRARAPELVHRRDDLHARITAFEKALARYYREEICSLVESNVKSRDVQDRMISIENAYKRAVQQFRTEPQSLDDTFNFEERDFPDAPMLCQFGLFPEDYDRLKELNAEIAPIEKAVPMPLSVYFWRWIGRILLLLLLYFADMANRKFFPGNSFIFSLFLIYMLGVLQFKELCQKKYDIWLDRRTGPQIQARHERIRARAPELVQRRDDLLEKITTFENAHAQYYQDQAVALAQRNLPLLEVAAPKHSLICSYLNALPHYRSKQPSYTDINNLFEG